MSLHWTYKPPHPVDLEQGDLLDRTTYLEENVLRQFHPYYAQRPDNRFFIVLTQSCDLTKRNGTVCAARYITVAPVRPLRTVIKAEFGNLLRSAGKISIGEADTRAVIDGFLRKVYSNNDGRYFFLRQQDDHRIAEDMCAVLRLGISIKAEHYEECLKARFLSLDTTFQAKLGWLVGQQYSRVGTQDWGDEELNTLIDLTLSATAYWCRDRAALKEVMSKLAEFQATNPGTEIGTAQLEQFQAGVKSKKEQAIDAILAACEAAGAIPPGRSQARLTLRRTLTSDAALAPLLPRG